MRMVRMIELKGEGIECLTRKNIEQVERIRADFQNSEVIILTEYQGLTVEEITELRDKCREAEIQYKVYKNRTDQCCR